MKRLFRSAELYLAGSTWKDLAAIKFCLFSLGLLAGLGISARKKRPAAILAVLVFLATYIPDGQISPHPPVLPGGRRLNYSPAEGSALGGTFLLRCLRRARLPPVRTALSPHGDQLRRDGHCQLLRRLRADVQPDGCVDPVPLFRGKPSRQQPLPTGSQLPCRANTANILYIFV